MIASIVDWHFQVPKRPCQLESDLSSTLYHCTSSSFYSSHSDCINYRKHFWIFTVFPNHISLPNYWFFFHGILGFWIRHFFLPVSDSETWYQMPVWWPKLYNWSHWFIYFCSNPSVIYILSLYSYWFIPFLPIHSTQSQRPVFLNNTVKISHLYNPSWTSQGTEMLYHCANVLLSPYSSISLPWVYWNNKLTSNEWLLLMPALLQTLAASTNEISFYWCIHREQGM